MNAQADNIEARQFELGQMVTHRDQPNWSEKELEGKLHKHLEQAAGEVLTC